MLNLKTYTTFVFIAFGLLFHSKANISFQHYGIEKGLPEVRIHSISQDSAGFIWMAGENSLYRFDGVRFKSYHTLKNDSQEESFGNNINLFTDSKGTLWVGTTAGLAHFDFSGDLFRRVNKGWAKEDVNDITEDCYGKLWMATNAGLAKLDPTTMETVWYTDSATAKPNGKSVLPANDLSRLTSQEDGKIWFSTTSGALFCFDPGTLESTKFQSIVPTSDEIQNITELRYWNNFLLISTLSHGFFWYDDLKKDLNKELFSNQGYFIHHFTTDNDSIVWLAGNSGLFRFNIGSGKYTLHTEEPGNPLSLRRTAVTYVYTDREQNLWVSSGLKGIDYGQPNTPFGHFFKGDSNPYQLLLPEVTAIEFDNNNNMWVGYEAGFLEKHTYDPPTKTVFYPGTENNTGQPGAILKIFSDSKNRIWFGGWNNGLQKLNPAASAFEIVPIVPETLEKQLKAADIRGIVEDNDGNLWISYHGLGLGRYDPETHKMELFSDNPDNRHEKLSSVWSFNLCIDKKNNLWVATAYGVSKLNLRNMAFENYFHEENNPQSLNSNFINTVFCDPQGNIWAGTNDGLNVYDPAINNFIPVLDNANNSAYSISDIQSTNRGEIWASTKSGILRLVWSQDSLLQKGIFTDIQFYNRKSGLLSTSYFARSSAISRDGIIYFGGNEGIDFFDANQASAYRITAPVPVLTEITIDGLPVWFDFRKEKTLELDHQHRMVSIRFASPAFNNSENLKFRYQLEGFDKQWHYTDYEQIATYTNLPSGRYTFRVETETQTGNWMPYDPPLSLNVKPPFWNTLPFYIVVTVILALLIFLVFYARSRIFLLRQKELEKIIDARTKELLYNNAELEKINQTKNKLFSIISHDLRSPFAGVLGILELLSDEESGIEHARKKELLLMAKNSAENTFELLENLLTWAHSQMKNTVSKPVRQELSGILRKNIELKETSAQQKEIELQSSFPDELEARFDRDMVNAVVRNLLNNALKFTHPGGKIKISASRHNEEVRISIADTGIGINQEDLESIFYDGNISRKGTLGEKGTGLGLIICREFVEKNAGRIWVTPNQPKGTVFHFTLPHT